MSAKWIWIRTWLWWWSISQGSISTSGPNTINATSTMNLVHRMSHSHQTFIRLPLSERNFHSIYPKLSTNNHEQPTFFNQASNTRPSSPLVPQTILWSASRLPRRRAHRALIEAQPPDPATELRRIAIARHGAISLTARDEGSRLDAFALGVAAAVASAKPSHQHPNLFRIKDRSTSLTRSQIPRPCTGTWRSRPRTARP